MRALLAEVVEVDALLETAAAAAVAGLVVAFSFSIAIYGMTRHSDLRRAGRSVAALGAGALGVAGLIVSIAAVVVGLVVMISG